MPDNPRLTDAQIPNIDANSVADQAQQLTESTTTDMVLPLLQASTDVVNNFRESRATSQTSRVLGDYVTQWEQDIADESGVEQLNAEGEYIPRLEQLERRLKQKKLKAGQYSIGFRALVSGLMSANPGQEAAVLRRVAQIQQTDNVGTMLNMRDSMLEAQQDALDQEMKFIRDQGVALGISQRLWIEDKQEFYRQFQNIADEEARYQVALRELDFRKLDDENTEINKKRNADGFRKAVRTGVKPLIRETRLEIDRVLQANGALSMAQMNEEAMNGRADPENLRLLIEEARINTRNVFIEDMSSKPGYDQDIVEAELAQVDAIFKTWAQSVGTTQFAETLSASIRRIENKNLLDTEGAVEARQVARFIGDLGQSAMAQNLAAKFQGDILPPIIDGLLGKSKQSGGFILNDALDTLADMTDLEISDDEKETVRISILQTITTELNDDTLNLRESAQPIANALLNMNNDKVSGTNVYSLEAAEAFTEMLANPRIKEVLEYADPETADEIKIKALDAIGQEEEYASKVDVRKVVAAVFPTRATGTGAVSIGGRDYLTPKATDPQEKDIIRYDTRNIPVRGFSETFKVNENKYARLGSLIKLDYVNGAITYVIDDKAREVYEFDESAEENLLQITGALNTQLTPRMNKLAAAKVNVWSGQPLTHQQSAKMLITNFNGIGNRSTINGN